MEKSFHFKDSIPVVNFYLDIRTIKSSPKLLFAVLGIDGVFHVALLDTGASINVIPENLASTMKETKEFKVKGVKGSPITVDKVAFIKFQLGDRDFFIDAYIIPSLGYDIILGAPFFRKYNIVLDFKRKHLRFGNS
jgi:hypothetical protein